MRHFLRPKGVQSRPKGVQSRPKGVQSPSGPITPLTFGVGVTARQAGLIAATGGTDRASACQIGTSAGAVALAAVAVAANQYGGTTAGAQIASSGEVHGSPWPMGKDGDARFVTYWACSVASSQLWARYRSWLGGWSRYRARVSIGRSEFYRISGADATPTPTIQNTSLHVERCDVPGRGRLLVAHACRASLARRGIATQSLRRKPCGQQTVEPVKSFLKIKNPAYRLHRKIVDAKFVRKSDAVNTGPLARDSAVPATGSSR